MLGRNAFITFSFCKVAKYGKTGVFVSDYIISQMQTILRHSDIKGRLQNRMGVRTSPTTLFSIIRSSRTSSSVILYVNHFKRQVESSRNSKLELIRQPVLFYLRKIMDRKFCEDFGS